jgi:hypothetical protein
MHISDPLPGSTHDAKATHTTGLSELLDEDNAIGDKGLGSNGHSDRPLIIADFDLLKCPPFWGLFWGMVDEWGYTVVR